MRCPRGSPRLTSIPLRTMNGLRSRTLESAAGTSTCQPDRSLPLKRLCGGRGTSRTVAQEQTVRPAITNELFMETMMLQMPAACNRAGVAVPLDGPITKNYVIRAYYFRDGS